MATQNYNLGSPDAMRRGTPRYEDEGIRRVLVTQAEARVCIEIPDHRMSMETLRDCARQLADEGVPVILVTDQHPYIGVAEGVIEVDRDIRSLTTRVYWSRPESTQVMTVRNEPRRHYLDALGIEVGGEAARIQTMADNSGALSEHIRREAEMVARTPDEPKTRKVRLRREP